MHWPRHPAGYGDEPALCAQGWTGAQRWPARSRRRGERAVIAFVIALLALSWANAFWAALLCGLVAVVMSWLAMRQIGGQTGDVLGAAEQVEETAVLLLLAARLGPP